MKTSLFGVKLCLLLFFLFLFYSFIVVQGLLLISLSASSELEDSIQELKSDSCSERSFISFTRSFVLAIDWPGFSMSAAIEPGGGVLLVREMLCLLTSSLLVGKS